MDYRIIATLVVSAIVISIFILTLVVMARQQRELQDWEREYEQGTQKIRERRSAS